MSKTFRLGAFLVFTFAIFALGVFLIGRNQARFKPTYRLRAQFQNVAGLDDGADVRVGGIRKGTVRKIQLPKQPDGKVTVLMELEKETLDVLKGDSVADIKSEGLLGNKYVEVSFGSDDGTMLKGGELIASVKPLDISDMMAKTDQILDTTKQAVESIRGAASNVNGITTKIDQGTGTVGALINDKSLYQQATASVTSLHEDADALKHNFFLRGFFKERGYENEADVKANEIEQIPQGNPAKTFAYDPKQLFDKPDSAKLKNQKLLKDSGQFLQTEKQGLVVIACSTDTKGDARKNHDLSEARAYVVRQYLVENYSLDDKRIKTVGLGESKDGGAKLQVLVYPPTQQAAGR
jgi:outer membrane protein OmpA-like peptidoglycan-associated protein